MLLLISSYILFEAYERLRQPPEIRTGIMLWVAVAGLLANLASMKLLHGAGHDEILNVKAAYLEVLTDMLGSLVVIAAALLMRPTRWLWLDPVISDRSTAIERASKQARSLALIAGLRISRARKSRGRSRPS